MIDKIIEAYTKLRLSMSDVLLFEKINVMLEMTPKAYYQLRDEANVQNL